MSYDIKFDGPRSLSGKEFTYCPGCHHGIIHRIIAEVIDEFDIQGKTLMVAPVGCSVFGYEFFEVDGTVAAHGRAPAVATGMKRANPENMVFTYQGDGDLAAIGTAEIIHAANRGERITTIFVNNAIYGMTGGQMAPTTLLDMKTSTSPYGRKAETEGYPIHVAEVIKELTGVAYLARTSVNTPQDVLKTKKAIKKAFQAQIDNIGFGMVEVLATCPTNWGLNPIESMKWLKEKMYPEYPLGIFIDKVGDNK